MGLRTTLGFDKRYKFVLWSIGSSLLITLALLRAPLILNLEFAKRHLPPGEWFHYSKPGSLHGKGLFIHIASIVPICFLAPLQFIPRLRRGKYIPLHRLLGYLTSYLLLLASLSATSIGHLAMGGSVDTQSFAYTLALLLFYSLPTAILAAKQGRIADHRRWMLRTMIWMSTIVTERFVLAAGVMGVSYLGDYHFIWKCDEATSLVSLLHTRMNTTQFYLDHPSCQPSPSSNQNLILVPASIQNTLEAGSAVRLTFGMSAWVALALHVIGVEVYIHKTELEDQRLRNANKNLKKKAK